MTLPNVIEALKRLNRPAAQSPRLPTEDEVSSAELKLGFKLPADYRYFLLQASDVDYGVLEPGRVTPNAGHIDLVRIANKAWSVGVSHEFLPFCESNGDYYCFTPDGRIALLSHNGWNSPNWPDLAHWIQSVWIEGFQELQNDSD